MPIQFVGEWCFESEEGATTTYALPSWIADGRCTKILSVQEFGFYSEGNNCDPQKLSLKTDIAPSGTAYIARITARCRPDGPVTRGTLQSFKFERYKGHLSVTAK